MNQEEYEKIVSEARQKLESLNKSFEEISGKTNEASQKLEEIKSKEQLSQTALTAIQAIQASVESIKQSVEARKIEADKKVDEINTFHSSQYTPLRDQILDPTTGLQAALSDAQQKKANLASLEEQAKIHFDSLKNSIEQYNNSLKALNDILATINSFFETSKTTATDYLTQIQALKADADALLLNIKEIEKNSANTKNNIDSLHEEAKTVNSAIGGIKEEAELIKKNINRIYEQATNDTQGGAFGKHVGFLLEDLEDWGDKIRNWTWILVITIILIFLAQVAFNDWSLKNLDGGFYLRFTFTTPIIFYLAFCTRQYGVVRVALDKYTFKKVMALSVEFHTQILKTNYPSAEKERQVFTLDVLQKIYETPYYDEALKVKDKITLDKIKFGLLDNEGVTFNKEEHKNGQSTTQPPKTEAPNAPKK